MRSRCGRVGRLAPPRHLRIALWWELAVEPSGMVAADPQGAPLFLSTPLDIMSWGVYNEGMPMNERHAANADNKALQALEIIEEAIIPRWIDNPVFEEVTNLHTGLRYAYWVLFGPTEFEDRRLREATWAWLGALYAALYHTPGDITVFNTSRSPLASHLDRRVGQTATRRPIDDPFDVFATNKSPGN